MSEVQLCPQARLHTPCPEGYIQWHAWAEEMSKTHKQIKCKGCGRYSIWVPKGNAMTDKDAMIEAVATDVEGTLDGLGIHLRDEPDSQQVARSIAHSAIAAIEPFMQAREQAAREEEKRAIVEWLRQDVKKLTAELEASNPYTATWLSLRDQIESADVYADMIEGNEHREQQDG